MTLGLKAIEIWKKWPMRRENKNICTLREFKILGKGLGIKIHTVLGGPKSHHMQWNLRRLSGHELAWGLG